MSNNLRSLMPRIVARGLLTMRQKAIFPRLVNADFSAEVAKKGDIIDVPLSQKIDVEDVQPSHQPPSPPDTNTQSVKITLNHWKKASFHLTDKDMDQIEAHESFVPLQMAEAIQALATAVNQSVIDVMQDTTSEVGTFLEVPFAPVPQNDADKMPSQGLQAVIDARRHLNQVSAPKTGRAFVPPLQDAVRQGFALLSETPDWFQWACLASIAASFGIRGVSYFSKQGRQDA